MCDLGVFLDGNDFSQEAIENGGNEYYRKQLANQMNGIISLLTSAMNIHLNILLLVEKSLTNINCLIVYPQGQKKYFP